MVGSEKNIMSSILFISFDHPFTLGEGEIQAYDR